MPRFFLHIRNGNGITPDEEGVELPGLDAARDKAAEGVRSILSEELKRGEIDLRGRIDIADGKGRVIATVPFSEVIAIRKGQEGTQRRS